MLLRLSYSRKSQREISRRFSADLAAILRTPPSSCDSQQNFSVQDHDAPDIYAVRRFALDCLRAGKVEAAARFIQRYTPEQKPWLDKQFKYFHTQPQIDTLPATSSKAEAFLSMLAVVPDTVKIDTEAGRIAHVLGEFAVFRAWAYGLVTDDGDGWVDRKELETVWRNVGIVSSSRHARRLIQRGMSQGYWSQDKTRKRIYLTGQVKLAAQLTRRAIETGDDIVGTNLPGRRRVEVSLAGSLQEASAGLYAGWLVSKDPGAKR